MKEQFNGFDGDKDGNLTPDELKKFIKSLSSKHTDEQIDKMIKEADEDGDGQFSFDGSSDCNLMKGFFCVPTSDKCKKWEVGFCPSLIY